MADQVLTTDRTEGCVRDGARGLPRVITARTGHLVMAAVLAATAWLFMWQASMLDLGQIGLPGPGFFPLVLGILLMVFSVAIGIADWRRSAGDERLEFGHPPVLITFAALLAVPFLFELLGGYVTLGLLGAGLLVFVAGVAPLPAGLWCVIGMAACWYFFQELLGVRLPMGPF